MQQGAQDPERIGGVGESGSPVRRFAEYLRWCRRQRRLSLRQIEKMSWQYSVRVSNSYLAYCEAGRLVPSLGKLITLSNVLGVPLQSFTERIQLDQQAAPPPDVDPEADWEEIRARGIADAEAGRLPAALNCFELALARSPEGCAAHLLGMDIAIVLKRMSRHYMARDLLERIVSDSTLDPRCCDRALLLLGGVLREMGRYTIAAMVAREALARAAGAGDAEREAHASCLLGNCLFDMGAVDASQPHYEVAVRHFRAAAKESFLAINLANLGNCLVRRGRFAEGLRRLREAEAIAVGKGLLRQQADVLGMLGQAFARHDDLASAERHLLRSNRIAREEDYHDILFGNTWHLREIALATGRKATATDCLRTLRHLRSKMECVGPEVRAYDDLVNDESRSPGRLDTP